MARMLSFFLHSVALAAMALALSWVFEGGFYSYHFSNAQGSSRGAKVLEVEEKETFSLVSAAFLNGTNVLLLGVPGKGYPAPHLADTIMLASFNDAIGITLTSIPRDLLVRSPSGSYTKVNSLYELGMTFSKASPERFIKEKIEEITGVPVDYVALIDVKGLEAVIDNLGGVTVEAKKDIADPFFPGLHYSYEPFYLKKGVYRLNGHEAVRFARSRYSPRGDFDRIERQQQLLESIKKEIKEKAYSLASLTSLLAVLKEHVTTDITLRDLPIFLSASLLQGLSLHERVIGIGGPGLLAEMHTPEGAYALIPKAGVDDYTEIREFFK